MVVTRTGSPSFPLPVQGSAHWAALPCQKSERLEETLQEEDGGRKPRHTRRDAAVSLPLVTAVFPGQESPAPTVSVPLVLSRTDPGENFHHPH